MQYSSVTTKKVSLSKAPPYYRYQEAGMVGLQATFCLLACVAAIFVTEGTLSEVDLALLPLSECNILCVANYRAACMNG